MKYVLTIAAMTLISAPALAEEPTVELITFPAVGQPAVAAPGEELYLYWKKYTVDGAKISVKVKAGQWLVEDTIAAGTQLVRVESKSGFKACVPTEGTLIASGLCLLDDDGDGTFDRHTDGIITRRYKVPAPYVHSPISVSGVDALKRTILFSGATGDSLRFSYREFAGDIARPAFTEELTVPREPFPQLIRLKGHTFEITGLTGLGLQYRLVN